MRGLGHEEAVNYLRETPPEVRIRFYKPQQQNIQNYEDAMARLKEKRVSLWIFVH